MRSAALCFEHLAVHRGHGSAKPGGATALAPPALTVVHGYALDLIPPPPLVFPCISANRRAAFFKSISLILE